MRPVRIALLIAALGAVQAHAGVFDDDEARRQIVDLKVKTEARFDQQAKAQLDLASQIQRQVEEIARLRGQIETLTYELETAKKRQQDFYLDLDTRLRKFEASASANATVAPENGANSKPAADPGKETQDYEAALNQFKAGKYKDLQMGGDAPYDLDYVSLIALRQEYGLLRYLDLFVNLQTRTGRAQELYNKWVGGTMPDLTVKGVYR